MGARASANVAAMIFGTSRPALFFVLAAIGPWRSPDGPGLPLTAFYGFAAARVRGEGRPAALLQAAVVALIGGFLIALKALLH